MTWGLIRRPTGQEQVEDDDRAGTTAGEFTAPFRSERQTLRWERRKGPRRRDVLRLVLRLTILAILLAANGWARHAVCIVWAAGSDGLLGRSWCDETHRQTSREASTAREVAAPMEEEDVLSIPSSSSSSSFWPPRRCSALELDTIRWQLPDDICKEHERKPWTNRCHVSFVTRCPDSTWLTHHYRSMAEASLNDKTYQAKATKRTVVYVGCNKGMDAINALRMVSNDPAIDKDRWRDAFFANATVQPGHCYQEFEAQFPVVDPHGETTGRSARAFVTPTTIFEAQAYCVEAMPVTARHLARTAQHLGWEGRFKVLHTAVSNEPSWAWFPNPVEGKVGVEGLGMDACRPPRRGTRSVTTHDPTKVCDNVTVTTLDAMLAHEPGPVDVLSIDVEGYDFNVLLGAKNMLPRVRYLEFEYNWKKPWGSQSLKSAMDFLEPHGFVCYWAGHKGRVWRITKCWRDAYNRHFWSNVACVNGNDEFVRPVAHQLERMFQETLRRGKELGFQIDQEFRAFYPDVVRGYVKNSDGQLQFKERDSPQR